MATKTEKSSIAENFIKVLRDQNWKLLRTLFTEDAVWSLPGSSLISGEAHGADAVVTRAQLITSYNLTFTLKHVLIGQYGVALSLNNTAERQGKILDEHLATVLSLRDEKIARIDTYLSDVDMANAFFV